MLLKKKNFWYTVKQLFSDKINHKETINIIGHGVTLTNNEVIAEVFNNYFCNIVKNLSLLKGPSIKEQPLDFYTDHV